MTTYCRITGKSRGLPKSNYFPLLPPISPADAKRFCRITGKSIDLPNHHYLPVLLKKNNSKKTNNNYHKINNHYRYLTPSLKNSPKILIKLLTDNNNNDNASSLNYVYTIDEKKCKLVISSNLESAIKNNKINDIMLAKDNDVLLIKLDQNLDIKLNLIDINLENLILLNGECIIQNEQKLNKKEKIVNLKHIFENTEFCEKSSINNKKVKIYQEYKFTKNMLDEKLNFNIWKWNEFNLINSVTKLVIKNLPKPIKIQTIKNIDLESLQNSIYQQPKSYNNFYKLNLTNIIKPFKVITNENDNKIIEFLNLVTDDQLEDTLNIKLIENLEKLPNLIDIPKILNLLNNVKDTKFVVENNKKIKGVEISSNNLIKFIPGQMIQINNNNKFIPGQTINTTNGLKFLPGIHINCDNTCKFLPGIIVENQENFQFISGQITVTNSGDTFIRGQFINMENDVEKFIPGETLFIDGELKFIPGIVHEERFLPGQILTIEHNLKFIPGQTVNHEDHTKFLPGQSVWAENGWTFVPGITDGTNQFIPGKMIKNSRNSENIFIPGQYVYVEETRDELFIPGINDIENVKFICGMKISVPNGGEQFIQGQIVKFEEELSFLPGLSEVINGELLFKPAENLQELKYEDTNIETCYQKKEELYADGVYGQIVQSIQGIEFFPGEINCLPKGKVVRGKLIRRSNDVKFVPGLMIDGSFVPGQVIINKEGEHFIPGQIIETKEGPKFIPGQIISTKNGVMKFIPGQTVKTANGQKFIPGQIIETKIGPTFIPGQIITMEDSTTKFIPGEVLDTSEGPRFVPGRVIENGDGVAFLPGQVIDTDDGLHFIAADFNDNEQEFTLQSFDIPPEELNLLIPQGVDVINGDMSIDSKMLKQLNEAGMRIGHEITTDIPEISIHNAPAMSAASTLGQKLKLDPVTTVKVGQIIISIVKICKLGEIKGDSVEIKTLNSILERVIHCKKTDEAYTIIANIIEKEFANNIQENVDNLHKYIASNKSPLKLLNKLNLIKEIVNNNFVDSQELLEKMILIIDDDDTLVNALKNIYDVQPDILNNVLERFIENIDILENENEILDTLYKSIVVTIKESSEEYILNLMKYNDCMELKTLILDTISLAKALDMEEIVVKLLDVIINPKFTNIFTDDRLILDILKKSIIMKQLAKNRPEYLQSLKNLTIDPYNARNDPNLIQLSKESQALLVIPENSINTNALPTSLLFSQNSLAMEQYLCRTKRVYNILVIIKNGIQAIIPREAAHSVLTGSVPYAVLDEKGLRYFQPKHVFAALKLPKIATNWFPLYKCEYKDVTNSETIETPIIETN
ncbi:uncharacterized protein [Rhodnius prolixus]|uniref:uncharacterized protein n=1 Tax=Rhodnius prolixus TaxID=13249 RepID=UPI003D18996B